MLSQLDQNPESGALWLPVTIPPLQSPLFRLCVVLLDLSPLSLTSIVAMAVLSLSFALPFSISPSSSEIRSRVVGALILSLQRSLHPLTSPSRLVPLHYCTPPLLTPLLTRLLDLVHSAPAASMPQCGSPPLCRPQDPRIVGDSHKLSSSGPPPPS